MSEIAHTLYNITIVCLMLCLGVLCVVHVCLGETFINRDQMMQI